MEMSPITLGDEDDVDFGDPTEQVRVEETQEQIARDATTREDYRKQDRRTDVELDDIGGAQPMGDPSEPTGSGEVGGQPMAASSGPAPEPGLFRGRAPPWRTAMQEVKERCTIKGFRWRSPEDVPGPLRPSVLMMEQEIRSRAGDGVWQPYSEVIQPDAGKDWEEWLKVVTKRGLSATQDIRQDTGRQQDYNTLILSLPEEVYEKFSDVPRGEWTDQMKFDALTKLTSRHKGETVEFCPGLHHTWNFVDGPCPEMPPAGGPRNSILNRQFLCQEPEYVKTRAVPKQGQPMAARGSKGGKGRGKMEDVAWHPSPIVGGRADWGMMQISCTVASEEPDWTNQRHRLLCPCKGRTDAHWEREVLVSNLGLMFRAFGDRF